MLRFMTAHSMVFSFFGWREVNQLPRTRLPFMIFRDGSHTEAYPYGVLSLLPLSSPVVLALAYVRKFAESPRFGEVISTVISYPWEKR